MVLAFATQLLQKVSITAPHARKQARQSVPENRRWKTQIQRGNLRWMWVAQFKSAIGSKLVNCALGRDSQTARHYELGRYRRLPLTITRGAATAPLGYVSSAFSSAKNLRLTLSY